MYDAGNPKPVLCDNLKGGRGREAGEGYKREGTYVCCCCVASVVSDSVRYSCLENPMDRGAWQAKVHGLAELDMAE